MSAAAGKEFMGPLQPHKSKLVESRVWGHTVSRPGPGSYSIPSTIGARVVDSTKKSAPAHGFRVTTHDGANILKHLSGKVDNDGKAVSIGAKAVLSRTPSSPKPGFGTSKREASTYVYSSFTYSPA